MRCYKRISSSILAAVSAMTMFSFNTMAKEPDKIVNVGGYQCFENDGNLWTYVDGEKYLVIDVDSPISECGTEVKTDTLTRGSSIGVPTGWKNSTKIDLSSVESYEDTGDITNSDYCSPVFSVEPSTGGVYCNLYAGFWLNTEYIIQIYTHNTLNTGWNYQGEYNIVFNVASQTKILFVGTASTIVNGFALKFLKTSSGEKIFDYKVSV